MTFVLPHLTPPLLAFLLTFSRAGAMIMLLPVLGDAGVSPRVRLAFALAVSFALAPVMAHFYPAAAPPTGGSRSSSAARSPRVCSSAPPRALS